MYVCVWERERERERENVMKLFCKYEIFNTIQCPGFLNCSVIYVVCACVNIRGFNMHVNSMCTCTKKKRIWITVWTLFQFSSTSRWYLCAWEGPYALHPSLKSLVPQRCPWKSSNVGLIDDGPFSSSQGRSLSASSFYASLLHVG